MPSNITDAQKCVWDFHKSDALAQTNRIKYDCFFMDGTENIKKLLSQDLKLEAKNAIMFFLDLILFFNIAVEKIDKKVISSSWSSRKRFF